MRSTEEWIAENDNQAIPARVKVRVFDRCNGRCVECTLQIVGGLLPAYDHVQALVNGGSHRESNLQLLCVPCHKVKTRTDVAEKSRNYRKRAHHLGVELRKGPKIQSAGFRKSSPQRTASRPVVRRIALMDDR